MAAASALGVLVGLEGDRFLNPAKAQGSAPVEPPASGIQQASFDGDVAAPGAPIDFRGAVKKLMPAVVSVDKRERVRRFFFSEDTELVPTGTGSGVILSKDGHIVTNFHVVSNAASVMVRLSDGRSFPAQLIGGDSRADLALLKIDAPNLVPAEMADSASLEMGEWVIAVGNPLGYSNTVSVGVVSNLNRSLPTGRDSWLVDSIQTDAAINSGNSGGALANTKGQVVGINSAIATNTGGSVGIGFAIPSNRVKRVVDDLLKFGRVRYGSPGLAVYQEQALLEDPRTRATLEEYVGAAPPSAGLVVKLVDPEGPAGRAGFRQLDVLLSIDGVKLTDPSQYAKLFMNKKPGDKVKVSYWRAGRTGEATLALEDLPGY